MCIYLFNWRWIEEPDRQEVKNVVSALVGRKIRAFEIVKQSFGYRKVLLNKSKRNVFEVKIDEKGRGTWKYEVLVDIEIKADE